MVTISQNAILKIMKGVQVTPQDAYTGEQGLDEIDLLDPVGFATDTYEMHIPSLKGGAVYADSPLSDGRTLISGAVGNVTETLRVQLTAGTMVQLAAMLSKLMRFKTDCRDFWSSYYQIEPIYLKHQVTGEPGPRFALLYDIEIEVEDPITPGDASRNLTIQLEREPYWRGLAPGDNPKKWTLENFFTGQSYNATTAGLRPGVGVGPDLVSGTINNRVDYATTSKQTYRTKNYVDIPDTSVPGDAPALVQLIVQPIEGVPPDTQQLFVSRFTPKTTAIRTDASSSFFAQALSFNAADMTAGANTTIEADTGAPAQQSSGSARRAKFTPADNNAAIRLQVDQRMVNNHRGRFAVFARARQHSGTQDDLSMWLGYGYQGPGKQLATLPSVHPTRQDGTGNTSYWPVSYMGVVQFPLGVNAAVSPNGYGLQGSDDLFFFLYVQRTNGTTAVLYVSDFFLVPLDEPSGYFTVSGASGVSEYNFDNTGYFTHGRTEAFTIVNDSGDEAVGEYAGQDLTLTPKTNQRLYFMTVFRDNTSAVEWEKNVYLNIIPRWTGLRDS